MVAILWLTIRETWRPGSQAAAKITAGEVFGRKSKGEGQLEVDGVSGAQPGRDSAQLAVFVRMNPNRRK